MLFKSFSHFNWLFCFCIIVHCLHEHLALNSPHSVSNSQFLWGRVWTFLCASSPGPSPWANALGAGGGAMASGLLSLSIPVPWRLACMRPRPKYPLAAACGVEPFLCKWRLRGGREFLSCTDYEFSLCNLELEGVRSTGGLPHDKYFWCIWKKKMCIPLLLGDMFYNYQLCQVSWECCSYLLCSYSFSAYLFFHLLKEGWWNLWLK